jgi:uroporphyrinogen-III decarboxylase
MNDWLKLKHLYVFHNDRIDWSLVEQAKKQQSNGSLVVAYIPGGFDTVRELMGTENACLCYYEQPELMHDIISTIQDTSFKVLEQITDKLLIDQLSVHEDLAGQAGPMIGPKQIVEFIRPYYRKIWELVSSRGTRLFDMDTDGNVEPVLRTFVDSGLNSMHPFEPAAGMDIVAIRQQYGGKLAMRGGIDKHVLRKSKAEIRDELEYKMQPLMQEGGIAFGLDHRIPNGTPIENYRYYVDLGREILGLPARASGGKGWRRMAF